VKAKLRALITLFLLCVILIFTYALIPGKKPAPAGGKQESAENAVLITDIPVSELLALAITNANGSFGILNSPDGIKAVSDINGQFDTAEMRAFVYLACHLTGIRPLDILPKTDDIANSIARFSLILTGGREYKFAFLRKSPVNEDYLLFSEEHQAVFLVPASSAEWFLRGAGDFLK